MWFPPRVGIVTEGEIHRFSGVAASVNSVRNGFLDSGLHELFSFLPDNFDSMNGPFVLSIFGATEGP
jgi:hypothetical protein